MTSRPVETSEAEVSTVPSRAVRWESMAFAGFMVLLAVAVLLGTGSIREPIGSSNTLGARVVPYVVGGLLLVAAVAVLVSQLRGKYAAGEEGEDIDPDAKTSWLTVLLLTVALLSLTVTIPFFGWPVGVVVLFTIAATALGAKKWWVALIVGVIVAVVTQVVFGELLGLSLPLTGSLTNGISGG